ncbi:MAG TPA: acyltransferase [Patescibacteria group bacterium]|nr:acyltransferase [Patescibacteria group bacterium]
MFNKIKKIFLFLLGMPKTIYFNLKYFDFATAIKLPVLVSHRVVLLNTSGKLIINANIRPGLIKIGFGNVGIFDKKRSRSIWEVDGNIIFNGKCEIGHGSKICVGGTLIFGNNFTISAESTILCYKKISFGDNCVLAWENLIMDTDHHKIIDKKTGKVINEDKEISIGNDVWIGCRCTILKGARIGNNCVVAANSTVTKEFLGEEQIIGGTPCKILRNDICWEV